LPGFVLTGRQASPDKFTYAKAALAAEANSKLSLAKFWFAFMFLKLFHPLKVNIFKGFEQFLETKF